MAEFGVTSAKIVLPIFTKVGDNDYVHLGDAEVDVPLNLQSELPFQTEEVVEEITEAIQSTLAPNGDADLTLTEFPPGTQELPPVMANPGEGPHSRACGVLPHQHGTSCHPNCPTCGTGNLVMRPGTEAQAQAVDRDLAEHGVEHFTNEPGVMR